MKTREMGLADASQRLSQTWAQTWAMVLRGELAAEKRAGRWFVDAADLERVLRERGARAEQPA